jgi:hypothetical protein
MIWRPLLAPRELSSVRSRWLFCIMIYAVVATVVVVVPNSPRSRRSMSPSARPGLLLIESATVRFIGLGII